MTLDELITTSEAALKAGKTHITLVSGDGRAPLRRWVRGERLCVNSDRKAVYLYPAQIVKDWATGIKKEMEECCVKVD
jgi:hypothetical protein